MTRAAVAAVAVAAGLAAAPAASGAAGPGDVELATTPGLYPEFRPAISSYVVRCGRQPLRIAVDAGRDAEVRVEGRGWRTGSFTAEVGVEPGAAVDVRTRDADGRRKYVIRCLPGSFPDWSYSRAERPSAQWQLSSYDDHAIFFDRRGTPVWWYRGPEVGDPRLLADDSVAFGAHTTRDRPVYERRQLDGTLLKRIRTVGMPTDLHDLLLLENGNYLVMAYPLRRNVDLSAHGGPSDATVQDAEIQEVDPDGNLVWSWNSKDHVELEETGRWWELLGPPSYDIAHINSFEEDGSSIILSLRHTDAVYSVSRETGEIEWKLGGTPTPERLQVLDDPDGDYPLGAQHDARMNRDGTLSVFVNNSFLDRPPRAVRYRIDEAAGTATLVQSLTDPKVDNSICCGAYRRSDDGSSVVTWGLPSHVTGFGPDGGIDFRFELSGAGPVYRMIPIEPGVLGLGQLRRGMDSMHPHDGAVDAVVRSSRAHGKRSRSLPVRVGAEEALEARLRGALVIERAGRSNRRIAIPQSERSLRPGNRRLALRLDARHRRAIRGALRRGHRTLVRFSLRLIDGNGNRLRESGRVRLR